MIKIFVTGDNHIGKKYDRFPDVKEQLIESRFDAMTDMVLEAEKQACDFFVITGDLFDNIHSIKVTDVRRIVKILASFNGTVLVLPGNHDYYTGDEKIWLDFKKAMSETDHNITILNEFRPYIFEVREKKVAIYPAYCQAKHSYNNNLEWIKKEIVTDFADYKIGIAHGAIQGITPDMKEEYFLMSEKELMLIPVDVWLIGHTHIEYPAVLSEKEDVQGYNIFNAGTHEQLDFSNRTEGTCFVISLEHKNGLTNVAAHKYKSGRIRYYDLSVFVDTQKNLYEHLSVAVRDMEKESIVRIKISGTVRSEDYINRKRIYQDILGQFLSYECQEEELSEEITVDKIRSEYSQFSFAAKFMEALVEDPVELQMAYELIQDCKNSSLHRK